MAERIVIGMSGGVDSSVAAARLVEQGFDLIGVTLHLWDEPSPGQRSRCCAPEDIRDAKRVADQLGFPHYTLDRRELFAGEVVQPFVAAYLEGRTPSPCSHCNATIKMPALLRLARLMGARRIATGHYARTIRDAQGAARLARGRDRVKDQAYFLYGLDASQLDALVLPLGESLKSDVRREALDRRLFGASKGESQDLCIIPNGDYASFVEARAAGALRPGKIVDGQGRVLGDHAGIHRFTIGQRKGLGIAVGRPVFVTRIDPASGTVVVDDEDSLLASTVVVERPILGSGAQFPVQATVQVRYRHQGAPARLSLDGGALHVRFEAPIRAASLGQVAVAYDGDLVVAGGVITQVQPQRCGPGDPGGNMRA